MSAASVLLFLGGLALLVAGAEALVRGASRLATAAGISPLVVGLTVVAYGTSSPEVAVSLEAAIAGRTDMALGNVVGSNIFNVLFILGVSALIVPLVVHQQLVRIDVPVMIGVSLLTLVLAQDGRIARGEGLALLAGMIAYTVFAVRTSRRESQAIQEEYAAGLEARSSARAGWLWHLVLIGGGLGLLVAGARLLTGGAIEIARSFGVSELVISLTLVAAGTSMPEVATSIMAAVRGERDIAVGNVVGSNIFNVLAVLGASAVAAPDGLPVSAVARSFDLPVAIAVAVACLPIFATGAAIARWEGAVFLVYYTAYVAYLYLDTSGHAAARTYGWVMLAFVLPLTALTIAVVAARSLLPRRAEIRASS
jgi:cation:H+ antiporter